MELYSKKMDMDCRKIVALLLLIKIYRKINTKKSNFGGMSDVNQFANS